MRILLTGSRGDIESVMAPLLSAAGHEVVGLDTDFYRACPEVANAINHHGSKVRAEQDISVLADALKD